jgi:hypothetical protein
MFSRSHLAHKRLICTLLVWVVLLAQWGALGHVLQHLGGVLSQAGAAAPPALTVASFEAPPNPSGDTATTHTACAWCLSAAQVLGSAVLNSNPRLTVFNIFAKLKSTNSSVLTLTETFTAYQSRAPPLHALM